MRMLALISHPERPSVRHRLLVYEPFLRQAGWDLELWPWPGGLRGWRRLGQIGRFDAVLVQRKLFGSWLLGRLRHFCRYLIFDFDDAIYGNDSYHCRGLVNGRRMRGFVGMVRVADLVLAGNQHLVRQAGLWTAPAKVHHLPTCLDPGKYPRADHRERQGFEVTWIGSSSTLRGLERIRPWLEEVGRRLPGAALKIVCDRSLRLDHLPVRFVPWCERTEAAELASADVGLSWVPDDDWSLGKCGLKLLQYMAAGLPVIANPVGIHRELVRHGENGFLVESPQECVRGLKTLRDDAALRRRMGEAGRRRIEADYSVTRGAGTWLELLRQAPRLAAR